MKKLIGKPQGNMRCVGLLLPRESRERLYAAAERFDQTLGETLIEILRVTVDELRRPETEPANELFPRRRPSAKQRRRLVDPHTVYVLLTVDEARTVRAIAEDLATSVSGLASRAIDSHESARR